jgi:uncharacterized membrane protein YdjX (TVP38/TMEM64 family)
VALVAALSLGQTLRAHLGLEFSPDAIRTWVAELGWKASAGFVALVTFRQFLLLPAFLLLTAGGLVFGAAVGTVLGGAGIFLSAALAFALARTVGRGLIAPRLRERLRRFEVRARGRLGLWLVGVATAHPTGPLVIAHWGAGFSMIAPAAFLLIVAPAGFARAGAVSFFGATLSDWGSAGSLVATGLLIAVVLPLAHPRVRRWLVAGRARVMPGPPGSVSACAPRGATASRS